MAFSCDPHKWQGAITCPKCEELAIAKGMVNQFGKLRQPLGDHSNSAKEIESLRAECERLKIMESHRIDLLIDNAELQFSVDRLREALEAFVKHEQDTLEVQPEIHRHNRYRENTYEKARAALELSRTDNREEK